MKHNSILNVLRALRPLKNRMHFSRWSALTIKAIVAAGAVSMVFSYVAVFVPTPFLFVKIAWVYLLSLAFAVVCIFFTRPSYQKVIKKADLLGLKERVVTAYELRNESSSLAIAQRKDALLKVESFNFKERFKIEIPKSFALVFFITVILTAVSFFIPSWSKDEAKKTENIAREIQKQVEEIEEKKEALLEKSQLSHENTEEAVRMLDELVDELKRTDSEENALKAISRSMNEIRELSEHDQLNKNLAELLKSMKESSFTQELGETMASGKGVDFKQKIEQLANKIEDLSKEQKTELSQALSSASDKFEENAQLSQSLSNLADSIENGNFSRVAQQLSQLEEALLSSGTGNSSGQNEISDEMLKQVLDTMQNAKYQIAELNQNNLIQPGAIPGGQVSQGGGQASYDTGQAPKGSGAPGGEGFGQQGSGSAGDSSGENDSGFSGDEQGSGGREPGDSQIEEYESIFVPERLGGDNDPSQVGGTAGDSGQSYWIDSDRVPVQKGEIISYSEVFRQYKDEAMLVLEGDSIPPVMKDIVRDYFMSLE